MAESWPTALDEQRLLVSGFGKWGGGIYDLSSGTPVSLDDLPTSGLAVGDGRLWRVLRAPGEQTSTCELLSYDTRGLRSYQRFDAIRDPHDVCWHDGAVHVSSSWDSVVWRIDAEGQPHSTWRGGSVPDSWHLNSLVVVEDRLHVCAFGRFDQYRGWKGDEGKKTGFVHDTVEGVDVLTGLAHPHTPRRVRDRWYVCDSSKGGLVECNLDSTVLRRVAVGRFSRGLAIVGDWALVGGNAHRSEDDDRAEIAVVELASFEVVERIAMPCLEVYDILAVPFGLARGVTLGFGANPARAVEHHRGNVRVTERQPTPPEARVQLVSPRVEAKLAATGQTLDSTVARGCRVEAQLPADVTAGSVQMLPVVVENRSALAIATVVPEPIRLGARWVPLDEPETDTETESAAESGSARGNGEGRGNDTDKETVQDVQEGRGEGRGGDPDRIDEDRVGVRCQVLHNPMAPLPHLVHPGERAETEIVLAAPDRPGCYDVRVAFHQPGLGWFGRRSRAVVTVLSPDAETLPVS